MTESASAADSLTLADEEAVCSLDSRNQFSTVQVDGSLAIVTSNNVEALSPSYRTLLGIPGESGRRLFVGGGFARMRTAYQFGSLSAADRRSALSRMVKLALERARDEDRVVVAPFVATDDLPAFGAAADDLDIGLDVTKRESWCYLELSDSGDMESFVASRDRKVRQTWNRDIRDAAELGFEYEVVPFDEDVTREAAPFISEVATNNGLTETPRLTEWRMNSYRKRPGDHFYLRISINGVGVAYTACRKWSSVLDVHTVGVKNDLPSRRSAYHYAAYLAPTLAAISLGSARVDLGYAHSAPKIARGCRQVELNMVRLEGSLS